MRCVQNRRFGYIFNPWSDGKYIFRNESQSGRSFETMEKAAAENPDIAARVELFLYRVPEELYDFENDPDALNNLVDDPAYASELETLRNQLEKWMEENGDPALSAFRNRNSREQPDAFMQEMAEGVIFPGNIQINRTVFFIIKKEVYLFFIPFNGIDMEVGIRFFSFELSPLSLVFAFRASPKKKISVYPIGTFFKFPIFEFPLSKNRPFYI